MTHTIVERCECPPVPDGQLGTCPHMRLPLTKRKQELCSGNCPASNPCRPEDTEKYRKRLQSQAGSGPPALNTFAATEPLGLGDMVEKALSSVGVTKDRVQAWVGGPCGCTERQQKLNALGSWAKRVVSGKIDKAKEYLDNILGEEIRK